MVRLLSAVGGVLALHLFAGPAVAVTPQTWRTTGVKGWDAVERDSVAVSGDGTIGVSWSTEAVEGVSTFVVWSLLRDGKDVLVATGDQGVLYRVGPDGTAREAARVVQPEITALGRSGKGRIVLGASPDGALYWLDDGTLTPAGDTPESYIWSIFPEESGGVLIATGNAGKIYRLAANGAVSVFADLQCGNVTGLQAAGDGYVATTSSPGRLVAVTREGTVSVLHDADSAELRSPVRTADGTVYFLANPLEGEGAVYRRRSNGSVDMVWKSPGGFVYALLAGAEGRLWVTRGSETGPGSVVSLDPDPPVQWIERLRVPEPQVLVALAGDGGPDWIGTGGTGALYRVGKDASLTGTATGPVQDAGGQARWGALSLEGGPAGTGVRIETRSGNTVHPDATWSPWASVSLTGDRGPVTSPAGRFLQWRVRISDREARVAGVRVVYLPENRAPRVAAIDVSDLGTPLKEVSGRGGQPGLYQSLPGGLRVEFQPQTPRNQDQDAEDGDAAWARRYRTVTWEAEDPDEDTLAYSLYLRRPGETPWQPLAEELAASPWIWDSSTVPDGWYSLRIQASDQPENPEGESLDAYDDTDPFLVDNTAPRVLDLRVADRVVSGVAEDALSPIKMLEMSVDGREWSRVFPQDGIPDSPREPFASPVPELDPGEHIVQIRVFDLAGNPGSGRVTVRVP
jgi:hypothetical protein